MRRTIIGILTLFALTASLVSCRDIILENRTECPSFLFFDITNADRFYAEDEVYTTVYSHPKGSFMEDRTTNVKKIQDKEVYFVVKGTPAITGYGLIGYPNLIKDGSEWTIPLGQSYDPLFRYSYTEEVQNESFIVPVEFFKEHVNVTLQFVGIETFVTAGGRFPFDIVVKGNTCGIDALTGVPIRGRFEYRPKETTIGRFEFTLPRQADRDLELEFYGREAIYEREGYLETYDLYNILLELGGITWTEKNLPDVYIEIDYQQTEVTVAVDPWTETGLEYEM